MIVPCNSVKIRGKQVVKGFPRVSVVNLDVKGHNGTHTFVPRAKLFWTPIKSENAKRYDYYDAACCRNGEYMSYVETGIVLGGVLSL
ncbi:MAG: hypothetical protein AABZ10_06975, partial [Nitrospirota bacterium]